MPVRALYAAAALLYAAVFVPLGLLRLVDADEGIYLLNARMTMEGQVPFFDYHYPQMFLLPYVYGAWMWLTGPSWYGGRLLSVAFTIAIGLVLVHHLWRSTGSRTAAAAGALAFAGSSIAFANLPLVKTYAFATLALFLAYAAIARGAPGWRWLAAGMLVGLAIDTRLYLAATVPVFLLAARVEAAPRRTSGAFLGGLALALAPNLYFYVRDPDIFLFNILGHHAVRSPAGLVGDLAQKAETVLNMMGINAAYGATSFQYALLLLANVAWLAACLAGGRRPSLAGQLAGVILLASLVPTPTYGQYFAILVPFLVVGVVELGAFTTQQLAGPAAGVRRPLAAAGAGLLAIYLAAAPIDVWWFTVGGTIVPGVQSREAARNWTIATITEVGRAIDDVTPAAARPVLSSWSGYFVETRARLHPWLANPNTVYLAPHLAPDQITRYKFMTLGELQRQIRAREAPVVVVGNWWPPQMVGPYRQFIVASGYQLARKVADAEIYIVGGPDMAPHTPHARRAPGNP